MFRNENFYFTCNGKIIQSDKEALNCAFLRTHIRVPGGKGGFGSMLRAIGARIEKTTNHEACRDLNGRRMRDVNNEKKIADWLQSQDEKEKERLRKRQQRAERILNPTVHYEDVDYTASLQGNAQKIEDALKAAKTMNTAVGTKRKTEKLEKEKDKNPKKGRMWTGMDDLTDDSSDDESSNEEELAGLSSSAAPTEQTAATIEADEDNQLVAEQENNKVETDSKETNNNKKSREMTDTKTTEKQPTNDTTSGEKKSTELIDLNEYKDANQLQALGLECLKHELKMRELKCGGTLQERAERLFRTKNVLEEQSDNKK